MTNSWVPGYLGTVKLGALGVDDISPVSNVMSINRTKASLTKPHFGSGEMDRVSGMKDATLDCAGHVVGAGGTPDVVPLLNTHFEAATVEFEWQLGTPTSDLDAGIYSGTAVMSNLSITTDAEDEYEWTFSLEVAGALSYTPGTTS